MAKSPDLVARDHRVMWHPYTQHGLNLPILPIESAHGAYLKLTDGREILDAISSWFVNIHGHSQPTIAAAIQQQASRLEHAIFAGFTHEPAVSLAETILNHPAMKNAHMARVFYTDSGATSVEVALKMAYQFQLNSGFKNRDRFIALNHSYHGDTFGAMSVGEPSGFHSPFKKLMTRVDFVEPGNLEQLEALLKEGESYAGFIFEPLIQACYGMKMFEPEFLEKAVSLCKSHGVLTICDEVFTGFYRTGRCFAFEHTDIQPDIICLAKGLTGGFLPLAMTLTTENIFECFSSQEVRAAFLHGHSYTANPIGCAAALASWELLHTQQCQTQIEMITARTRENLKKLSTHPQVKTTRCLGTVGAVESKKETTYFTAPPGYLSRLAIEKGVLLRPYGNVFYSVPPYCVTAEEVDRIYQVALELIEI